MSYFKHSHKFSQNSYCMVTRNGRGIKRGFLCIKYHETLQVIYRPSGSHYGEYGYGNTEGYLLDLCLSSYCL